MNGNLRGKKEKQSSLVLFFFQATSQERPAVVKAMI